MNTAQRMMELFASNGAKANRYEPTMTAPNADGKVVPVEVDKWCEKPTLADWERHFGGQFGLGIIPPGDDGKVLFGAIDIDDYRGFDVDGSKVVTQLYREKLPLVPVATKSPRGRHLLLLATEPVKTELMESALRSVAGRLGVKAKDAGGKTDILVKQNVWMPHVGGDGRHGVKDGGFAMTVHEFLGAAENARQTPEQIAELANPPAKMNGTAADGRLHAEKKLAEYCAELAAKPDGSGRNTFLNKALHEMGRMIAAGWIVRDRVAQELKGVADSIGMDQAKTDNLIRRSVEAGMRKPPPDISARNWRPLVVRVADVPSQEVKWLWPGRIARAKLTVIAGHPGISKSTLTIDLAARITTGGKWPCGEGRAPTGSVLMVTSEDDVGDTIHPRLAAAGADVRRVHVLRGMTQRSGSRRGFDLMSDVDALEAAVREINDVMLVVIDPISAYMGKPGKVDTHRVSDVRAMLEPLQAMAERSGAAVVAINHLTKGGSTEALMRVLGSVGMVATSRASYLVARDKDDADRRLFLPAKNNIGDDRTGFAFRISSKPTGYDKPTHAIALDWEPEKVTTTADEALATEAKESDGRRSDGAETAKAVIGEMLRNGPRSAKEVQDRLRELSVTPRSEQTARKALGVKANKRKDHWEWFLPGQAQDDLPI